MSHDIRALRHPEQWHISCSFMITKHHEEGIS
jgi:hypothetical protein